MALQFKLPQGQLQQVSMLNVHPAPGLSWI